MLVLPMVVLNMGGEMVNILRQRLSAQLVEEDKGIAVLRDVLNAMYAPEVSTYCAVCVCVCVHSSMCCFAVNPSSYRTTHPHPTHPRPKSSASVRADYLPTPYIPALFVVTNFEIA